MWPHGYGSMLPTHLNSRKRIHPWVAPSIREVRSVSLIDPGLTFFYGEDKIIVKGNNPRLIITYPPIIFKIILASDLYSAYTNSMSKSKRTVLLVPFYLFN